MSIKYIECKGTPRATGRIYGEAARDEIKANIAIFNAARKAPVQLKNYLSKKLPEIYDEIIGISEGAGIELDHVISMNQWPTKTLDNCTAMSLNNSQSVLLGKNNDGAPNSPYHYVLRKISHKKGLELFQVTYAGWLSGLDCMNSKGLVIAHTSVGSKLHNFGLQLDIRLVAYQLMKTCATLNEFVCSLSSYTLSGKGFGIVITDSEGNNVVVEAAVPALGIRDRNKEFIYSTNHFISEALKDADNRTPEGKNLSNYRLGYLKWREYTNPPQNVDDLKDILSSHEPWAPCRHGGVHKSVTEWSFIANPKDLTFMLCDGAPCCNTYKKRTF